MKNRVKVYDLAGREEKAGVRNQRKIIYLLRMEANTCRNNGDYLQEMTINKVVKRLQKSLDKYIVDNFPIRY